MLNIMGFSLVLIFSHSASAGFVEKPAGPVQAIERTISIGERELKKCIEETKDDFSRSCRIPLLSPNATRSVAYSSIGKWKSPTCSFEIEVDTDYVNDLSIDLRGLDKDGYTVGIAKETALECAQTALNELRPDVETAFTIKAVYHEAVRAPVVKK